MAVASGPVDLMVDAEASFSHSFVWLVDDDPKDLTGYAARLQVRRVITDDEVVLDLVSPAVAGSGLNIEPLAGRVTVLMADEDTDGLSGKYVYDLLLTAPDGVRTRLVEGKVRVDPAVTRD